MGRSSGRWLKFGAALVAAAAVIAIGIGALSAYRASRVRGMLDDARSLVAAGEWQKAKDLFGYYLIKHPGDAGVMREFADASLRITDNRRAALRDAAGALYQIALAEPGRPEAAIQLLRMLEQNAYWGDLEYYASALMRVIPQNQLVQYYRACALDHLDRDEEAISAYQRLAETNAQIPDIYGNLALLTERKGDSAGAGRILEAAPLASIPGALELQRARLETARQHFDQARELLGQARGLLGATLEVCRAQAELAMASRNWSEAEACFDQCRTLAPSSPEYYLLLAIALQRQDKRDGARQLLEQMDPLVRASSPEIMTTLCEIYIDQNRLDDAANAAAELVRAYPDHVLVHQYVEARMMLARGDTANAIERLVAVVRGNPELASARYHLALAYLRQGDHEDARAVLESFLRDFPQDQNALALRQIVYAAEIPPEQAVARAKSLLAAPDVQPAQLMMAARALLERSGSGKAAPRNAAESAAAADLLWRAAELAPTTAGPYQLLVRLYVDQDDIPLARHALDGAAAGGVDGAAMHREKLIVALAAKDASETAAVLDAIGADRKLAPRDAIELATMASRAGQVDAGVAFLESVAGQRPENAPLLYTEAAILCLRAGLDEKALSLIERDTGGAPVDAALTDARMRAARLLAVAGSDRKLEAAARLVALAREGNGTDPAALLVDARIRALKTTPDYNGARQLVEQVASQNPSNAEAILLLSQIDFAQGRVVDALDRARAAAGLSPNDPDILLFKAEMEQASNRPADARETLRSLIAGHPEMVSAGLKLFENYLAAGYVTEAEALLDRIEKAHPNDTSIDFAGLRARIAAAKGQQTPEALETLRNKYQTQPDKDVLREFVQALKKNGDLKEAERILVQATSGQFKNEAEPWAILADCYLDSNDAGSTMKASSAVTRALLISPDDPAAMVVAVRLFLREGNPGGALSMCERYLQTRPEDAAMLSQQASLLASAGRPQEALDAINRSLRVIERPAGVFVRATVLLALGKYEEALADLQKVAGADQIDPADHDAAMAEAYAGLKENEVARRYYDSAKDKFQSASRPLNEQMNRLKGLFERGGPQ